MKLFFKVLEEQDLWWKLLRCDKSHTKSRIHETLITTGHDGLVVRFGDVAGHKPNARTLALSIERYYARMYKIMTY